VGTQIRDEADGRLLADLAEHDQIVKAAKGGRGGLGNDHFKSPTRQTPRYAQPGEPGEERRVVLELKLLADVGLIGLPNAGKSTLISVISSARPKVADYPFTTLVPNLGVVKPNTSSSFVVADIPGLIAGAHRGKGLGHQFLRHVERTAVLVHLVDVSGTTAGDPIENVETLENELGRYNEDLLRRHRVVAATKIDALGDPDILDRIAAWCGRDGIPFFPISAVTHRGLDPLVDYLGNTVKAVRQESEAGGGNGEEEA
jgi:GTP-binding protein